MIFRQLLSSLILGLLVSGTAAAQTDYPPAVHNAYHALLGALDDHDRAVFRHDLVATQRAQDAALEAWRQLPSDLRNRIEGAYPGTYAWLDGGDAYSASSDPRRPTANVRPAVARRR